MADIDAEIQRRLQSASRAFGRLRERVFDVRDLSTKKMTLVYKAVILPTLLIYGSETWVTYQRHLKALEKYINVAFDGFSTLNGKTGAPT